MTRGPIPRSERIASQLESMSTAGVAEIFGPGSNVLEAANAVLAQVEGIRRNR